jgi:hypothetical protein
MADMALYCRTDGLLEPRSEKSLEWVKSQKGQMIIADIAADTRSSLQNRFLNGWVYCKQVVRKLNEAGLLMPSGHPWTRDTIHAAFQDCFLVKSEFLLNGRHHKVYESTASMSRKRFSEYIDDEIKPFCWDMWEITIDDPNEGYWLEVMKEMQRRQ